MRFGWGYVGIGIRKEAIAAMEEILPPRAGPQGLVILDGAMGTELEARGACTDGPAWSARALFEAPELVARIHSDYLHAGAEAHTANTFRTTPRGIGASWRAAMRLAVEICRETVGPDRLVLGSVAPLEDCWHPERSPASARREHQEIADALADCGVDILLCETFAHTGEAMIAVECAVQTGIPVWMSFTSGPFDDLSSPAVVSEAARGAVLRGASAVLVNCTPAVRLEPYVRGCLGLGVPVGARGNAGAIADGVGYGDPLGPERYLALARGWRSLGASLIGGCCGIGPEHICALAALRAAPLR